jgi:hypothetical protein
MGTPTTTSANCYCLQGTYPSEGGCAVCNANSYCEGGGPALECPQHSSSKPGARTRSDCKCDEGYYGGLAEPDSQCKRLPLAQRCDGGECSCAEGWTPIYNETALRCVLECELGQYARIDSKTFAKVCSRVCCLSHEYHTHTYVCCLADRLPPVPSKYILVQQANRGNQRQEHAVHAVPSQL